MPKTQLQTRFSFYLHEFFILVYPTLVLYVLAAPVRRLSGLVNIYSILALNRRKGIGIRYLTFILILQIIILCI